MKKFLHGTLAAATIAGLSSCDEKSQPQGIQQVQGATLALVTETLKEPAMLPEPIALQLPISPEHSQIHPEIAAGFGSLIDTLGIRDILGVSTLHTDNNFKDTVAVVDKHTPSHDLEPLRKLALLNTVQVGEHSFRIIQSRKEGSGLSAANIVGKVGDHPVTSNWTLYDISSDRPSVKDGDKSILQLRGKFVVKNGPTYTTNWELEENISK